MTGDKGAAVLAGCSSSLDQHPNMADGVRATVLNVYIQTSDDYTICVYCTSPAGHTVSFCLRWGDTVMLLEEKLKEHCLWQSMKFLDTGGVVDKCQQIQSVDQLTAVNT